MNRKGSARSRRAITPWNISLRNGSLAVLLCVVVLRIQLYLYAFCFQYIKVHRNQYIIASASPMGAGSSFLRSTPALTLHNHVPHACMYIFSLVLSLPPEDERGRKRGDVYGCALYEDGFVEGVSVLRVTYSRFLTCDICVYGTVWHVRFSIHCLRILNIFLMTFQISSVFSVKWNGKMVMNYEQVFGTSRGHAIA